MFGFGRSLKGLEMVGEKERFMWGIEYWAWDDFVWMQ